MIDFSSLHRDSATINFLVSRSYSTSSPAPKLAKDSSLNRSQSRRQKLQSWRVAIAFCVLSAGFTLFVNLALTIWASTKGFEGGIATIQEGDCTMTKNLDLWLHLGINLLSTVLLGASNYTMQCLSAPTRDEINNAHQQRISCDIGIPSVRNLGRISRRRRFLWWMTALSSIPLHFLYNSAVFSTLSTHPYTAAVVSHDFLMGAPFSNKSYYVVDHSVYNETVEVDIQALTTLRDNQSTLEYLSNAACLKAYRNEFVPDRLDVLAVSSATNNTSSLLSYWPDNVPRAIYNPYMGSIPRYPYGWTCTQTAGMLCPSPTPQNWTVFDSPIEYCLSKQTKPSCKLQLSLVIMVIVILFNFAKAISMSLTIWKPSSIPLLTLGDVVSSFLDQPDPYTEDNCLANKQCFREDKYARSCMTPSLISDNVEHASNAANDGLIDKNQQPRAGWDRAIRTFKPRRYRWYHAASLKRWLLCISLCTFTLVIAGILLGKGLGTYALGDMSMSHLWSLGYGGISSETIIHLSGALEGKLIPMIFLVNLPQALLSFLYLTYNALFTSMLLAEEWDGFAHQRKTLRVTCPVGKQRSTYWLQLPYSYGIPLLVMSGILHWLVSQSIFLVRLVVQDNFSSVYWINTYRASDSYRPADAEVFISRCGYSPIAIITVIPLGALLLFLVIANGFRKYNEGMPLAGSCSAAISAACHRPEKDVDAAVLPVLWGAVSTEGAIGHCCFTSFEVSAPVEGESYADRDAMSSMDFGTATGAGSSQAGSGLRSRT